MNRKLSLWVVGIALAGSLVSLAGNPPGQSDLAKDVERLRTEVNELKKKSGGAGGDADTLRVEVKKLQTQLAETNAYLAAQSDNAQALAEVLNDAERKGFTFGINPESRVALLSGLHEFCDGLRRNVPGKKDDTPEKKEPAGGQ